MQLAQRAGLKRHVNAGEFVGDRKALDVGFLRGAAVEFLGGHSPERIAEGWELFAGERRGRGPELRL